MKQFIKNFFSEKDLKKIRSAVNRAKSRISSNNLNELALIWGTDKWAYHWYTPHYHNHFKAIRRNKLNILEIGVGGYENPLMGGNSLRAWKYYFPKSNIYAIDIYEKEKVQENRIKIFKGSQTDQQFLEKVCNQIGEIDIIIDDGSHMNDHVIKTFKILFPYLKQDGIYVIEDTETAYWPEYGGDSKNLNNPGTSINFLKSLVDSLNHKEFIRPGYIPSYFDLNIISVHFYHNLAFIMKGKNDEASINIINNNFHRLDNIEREIP